MFNVIVVGNDSHHVQSVLALASRLKQRHPELGLFVVCRKEHQTRFAESEAVYGAKVIALGAGEPMSRDTAATKPSGLVAFIRNQYRRLDSLSGLPVIGRLIATIVKYAKETSLVCYLRERNFISLVRREISQCEQIFDRLDPQVVLAFRDFHPDIEASILCTARKRNVKVLLPYVSNYAVEGGLKVRRDLSGRVIWGYDAFVPFSLYRFRTYLKFKAQVVENIFFQHPVVLNALSKVGALSTYPWCAGNGCSDIVCVDTLHTSQIFERQGVPASKIRLTGGVVYDNLFAARRDRNRMRPLLDAKYGFDPSRRLVVLSVPHHFEQGMLSEEAHWDEVNFVVGELAASSSNLLLSIHPQCDRREYEFLERKFACKIADENSAEILPLADVFVASYSSLLVWAVLSGVHTINVDLHGFDLDIYDYLESVTKVSRREELLPAVKNACTSDVDFSRDWKTLGRAQVFDGRTIDRYLELSGISTPKSSDASANFATPPMRAHG